MSRFVLLLALLTGCVEPALSTTESAATVGNSTDGCSTSVVIGLSKQIADEVSCMRPTGLVRFKASSKLAITSNAVLPYLSAAGREDLVAAANGGQIQINSAFRTIAQQYLLVRWHQQGRCGITATAPVGTSNHESGRAIDVANYSARRSALGNRGWVQTVPGDEVHFDHLASPDIRGLDTKAFQRLWNRNHPDDTIAEDGDYGPQTEARLKRSPAEGFAKGPTCLEQPAVEVVSVRGPDRAPPAAQVHFTLRLKNTGATTWPADTQLVTADDMASPLADPSWTSDTVLATLDDAIAVGETATLEIDVTTPAVTEDTGVMQLLALKVGGTVFGEIELAVTVALDGEDTSAEGTHDDDGGCSTSGSSGIAMLGLVLGALLLRCRRAVVARDLAYV